MLHFAFRTHLSTLLLVALAAPACSAIERPPRSPASTACGSEAECDESTDALDLEVIVPAPVPTPSAAR